MNRTTTDTLDLLLLQVETLMRHEKVPDLGIIWLEVVVDVNTEQGTPARRDAVTKTGGEEIKFDMSLLETSKRSSTGFSGVYATSGSTFRALVPDPANGGSKYLPSRPTAVQAAIDRYKWYEDHGLPYGNVARYVEHYQSLHVGCSVEEALIAALEFADRPIKHPFTRAQADRAIESYRAKHRSAPLKETSIWGQVAEIRQRASAPALPSAEEAVTCPVCADPIKDHEPKSFVEDTLTLAHAGCLDLQGRPLKGDDDLNAS